MSVYAEVAKLVDAPDLGSGAVRYESSSLSFRTIYLQCYGYELSHCLLYHKNGKAFFVPLHSS